MRNLNFIAEFVDKSALQKNKINYSKSQKATEAELFLYFDS